MIYVNSGERAAAARRGFVPHSPGDELYTVAQAAKYLQTSMNQVSRAVRAGAVKAWRVNGLVYLLRSDLDRLAANLVNGRFDEPEAGN